MFRKFNLNFASAAFHFFIEHFFSITFKLNFKSKWIFFIKAFLKWKSIIISRKTFWAKASNICTRDKENVLTYFHSIWKEQKHSYEIDNEKNDSVKRHHLDPLSKRMLKWLTFINPEKIFIIWNFPYMVYKSQQITRDCLSVIVSTG